MYYKYFCGESIFTYMMKTLLISIILIFFSVYSCKIPTSEKCKNICTFSRNCAISNIDPVFINEKVVQNFEIQCFNTCTMIQDDFITCYEKSKSSCTDYYNCILRSGVFN